MPNKDPWDELPTDKEKILFLKLKVNLAEDVDAVLEKCYLEKKDLAATIDVVFKCVAQHLSPTIIFLKTQNEDLRSTLYAFGATPELLEQKIPHLLSVSKMTKQENLALDWFAMPLDMSGETMGSFGIAFSPNEKRRENLIFDLLNTIAEELDDSFYAIQANRIKHMTILEIQRSLKSKVLSEAIDRAIALMGDFIPIQDLAILYLDEDFEGKSIVQYVVYRDFQKIFDSVDKPMPILEELIRSGKQIIMPGNRDLEKIIPIDGATETILLDGLVVETLVGKMVIRPPEGTGLSVASREIIQVFAESLRQRLVDFNREKNSLRHFFSPEVVRKLLKINDYEQKYLSPQQKEIGIIYSDVSGFTKLSEQVLKDPKKIANFVNQWSHGVVQQLFAERGTLDKLVGDCVIGLLGPPFYEFTPSQLACKVLRIAVKIRNFTMEFLKLPENSEIQASPLFQDFGVSQGVNFCPANVGLIGPNNDLTAFSSGMNNTARLQGLAKKNEILVMPSIKQLAEATEPGLWSFDGPFSTQVKNVKEPLDYFKLKT